jgi:protein-tyrosine phosphatase
MSPDSNDPYRVLFVCLGNICRSPLAEGVFRHLVQEAGLDHAYEADSAGTGAWHAGEDPDPRSQAVAGKHGVSLQGPARKVEMDDFSNFDLILAMDQDNRRNLEKLGSRAPGHAQLRLLRDFDPEAQSGAEVPDPYYGGPDGFDQAYELVRRSCEHLLHELEDGGLSGE